MTALGTVAVVGPTAAGKSDLAVALAQRLSGEVVNADSMQLYRGMDIGTAKLTTAERHGVPHHLLDVLDVTEPATVAEFQALARTALDDCLARGVVPVLAGGSALYVRAVLDDFAFPGTDPVVRAALEADLAEVGAAAMHGRLQQVDPAAAERILPTNGRRVVRALEVVAITGGQFTARLPGHHYADPRSRAIGLDVPRDVLDARIEARVDAMWRAGLVDEVRGLEARGLREGRTASRALGYAQVLAYLAGECTEDEARDDDRARHPPLRPPAAGVVRQGPAGALAALRRRRPRRPGARGGDGSPRRVSRPGVGYDWTDRLVRPGGAHRATRPPCSRRTHRAGAGRRARTGRGELRCPRRSQARPKHSPAAAAAPDGHRPPPPRDPVEVGRGGAVSSVDPDATRVGLRVLRDGGTAVDAAVATAAALGVTEPYSAGLGGGGYFVLYQESTGETEVLDGRETAPAAMPRNAFIDPDTGDPYPFFPDLVTSGVSVGVPGTPQLWEKALDLYGTYSLRDALAPAAELADRGFVVDKTFNLQTEENAERFDAIRPTRKLFLPGGEAPEVGSVFRNPQLARTYRMLGKHGMDMFYRGPIAEQIARVAQDPPTTAGTDLPVPAGFMEESDLADYRVPHRVATEVRYRGLRVRGMPPSSSGGSTVGESLNILRGLDVSENRPVQSLHSYLEASALAFADRSAYRR